MQGKYLENNEITESFSGIHRRLVWELWILHVPERGFFFRHGMTKKEIFPLTLRGRSCMIILKTYDRLSKN